jgi:hypothetical protein
MPKWNAPIPLREGKRGRCLVERVERAYSRRRPRSGWLGETLAREEAGCPAGTAANRVQRTPLTIRASFLATKTRSPMAAASAAKRKAVRARSGGLGGDRV